MLQDICADQFSDSERQSAFVAALPLAVLGTLVAGITVFVQAAGGIAGLSSHATSIPWHRLAIVIGIASSVAVLGFAILGLVRLIPAGAYSYISALAAGSVVSLNLVIDDRPVGFSFTADLIVVIVFTLSCLIVLGSVSRRGWRHSGLLSLAGCGTITTALLFFAATSAPSAVLAVTCVVSGLVEGALVFGFVYRRSDRWRIAILVAAAGVNATLSWIVEAVFRSVGVDRPIRQYWALVAILTVLLLMGTLTGIPGKWATNRFGRVRERRLPLR